MDLADGYICRIRGVPRDPVIHATYCAGNNIRGGRPQSKLWTNAPPLCSLCLFRLRSELLHGRAEVPRLIWVGASSVSLSTAGIVGTGIGSNLYQSDHPASFPYITSRAVWPVLRSYLFGFHSPRADPLPFHEYSPRPATRYYIPSSLIMCFRRASSLFDRRMG